MYERDDLNVVNIGTSAQPFAQYTPAVVAPAGERQPEWWIAHRLLQELGKPSMLDDPEPDPWAKWRHMLQRGSGIDLAELQAPATVRVLPRPAPGRFFDEQVYTGDGRIDCCPPSFAAAIERCAALFAETATPRSATAACASSTSAIRGCTTRGSPTCARMKRGGRTTNPLSIHPDDAAAPRPGRRRPGRRRPAPTARSSRVVATTPT